MELGDNDSYLARYTCPAAEQAPSKDQELSEEKIAMSKQGIHCNNVGIKLTTRRWYSGAIVHITISY